MLRCAALWCAMLCRAMSRLDGAAGAAEGHGGRRPLGPPLPHLPLVARGAEDELPVAEARRLLARETI
jgi:hypothetical protein